MAQVSHCGATQADATRGLGHSKQPMQSNLYETQGQQQRHPPATAATQQHGRDHGQAGRD